MNAKGGSMLENIIIKNFKCFKDFSIENLQKVNLIGGKNNVGKTAFMEACYVNVHAQTLESFLDALINIKTFRDTMNILDDKNRGKHIDVQKLIEHSNHIFTHSNINYVHFEIKNENGIREYVFEFNKQSIAVNAKDFYPDAVHAIRNIEFIDNCGLNNNDIIALYSAVQKKDKEQYLNDAIHLFDDTIEAFKIIDEKPQCKVNGEYLELFEFGDGLRQYISIICALYSCEDGYLFLDEIENGIHYTQFDRLWGLILRISQEQNIQVFATTHSKECIESNARASLSLHDISFVEFGKNRNGEIKSIVMDFDRFHREIDSGNGVRGW
jgi:AAA15 family ATPase/GTPase